MKKILLLAGLAAGSLSTFAQSVSYGIKGGVNFAELAISAKGTDITASSGSRTTFNAGVFADFRISKFSIQPSVLIMGKGGTFTQNLSDAEGNPINNGKATISLTYLQVPVDLLYHVDIVPGDIFFGAGPYLAYGLSGKGSLSNGTTTTSEDATFGSDGEFKSTEVGVNFTAGLKLKGGFLFNVNYDLGLTNIANNSGDGRIKHRVLGLSVGYAF